MKVQHFEDPGKTSYYLTLFERKSVLQYKKSLPKIALCIKIYIVPSIVQILNRMNEHTLNPQIKRMGLTWIDVRREGVPPGLTLHAPCSTPEKGVSPPHSLLLSDSKCSKGCSSFSLSSDPFRKPLISPAHVQKASNTSVQCPVNKPLNQGWNTRKHKLHPTIIFYQGHFKLDLFKSCEYLI